MTLIGRMLHLLRPEREPISDAEPSAAYDLWSHSYDAQPDNLMLALDEEIFCSLLDHVTVNGKIVADIGCGTGRHWGKLLSQNPQVLYGYDVSEGMLERLKAKYPGALVHHMKDNYLPELADKSVDVVISTLTVAHIENVAEAIGEWDRVLKTGGTIIVTDYHPEALAKGGKRTFSYNGATMAVKNFVHSVEKIRSVFIEKGYEVSELREKVVDDSVRSYYEKQQALKVFERFKHVPIIYGMRLTKKNAVT